MKTKIEIKNFLEYWMPPGGEFEEGVTLIRCDMFRNPQLKPLSAAQMFLWTVVLGEAQKEKCGTIWMDSARETLRQTKSSEREISEAITVFAKQGLIEVLEAQ